MENYFPFFFPNIALAYIFPHKKPLFFNFIIAGDISESFRHKMKQKEKKQTQKSIKKGDSKRNTLHQIVESQNGFISSSVFPKELSFQKKA